MADDHESGNPPDVVSLETAKREALEAYRTFGRITVGLYWEMGRAFAAVKEVQNHGEWRPWLKENDIPLRSVQRAIKLYRRYPEKRQLGVFANVTAALEAAAPVATRTKQEQRREREEEAATEEEEAARSIRGERRPELKLIEGGAGTATETATAPETAPEAKPRTVSPEEEAAATENARLREQIIGLGGAAWLHMFDERNRALEYIDLLLVGGND